MVYPENKRTVIHQAKSYIRFLRLSKNKHGIHSPFVFDLTTKCFNDKTKHSGYPALKRYRKALIQDPDEIEMKDFGEGSRIFKGNARKVSEIVKIAGLTKKRQKLLYRLAAYFDCKNILELGTSVGLGSIALASPNIKATVHTVEGCTNTLEKAKEYFKKFGFRNIVTHNAIFKDYLSNLTDETFDLILVDGDHNGERTYEYFQTLLKHIHNDSLIIFDDIYWSESMTEAWNKICKNERVTVSIDTFQWGLVFFRKEQQKQHFVIRL